MAFGSFNPHRQQALMAEINVTPMVDVMLVLLVIFIITAPMFTHAIKLELPNFDVVPSAYGDNRYVEIRVPFFKRNF